MSENSCCSFCEELPTLGRPGRGSAGKCPLCKQALWQTPDGVTHRLVPGTATPSAGKWLWLSSAGIGLTAGVCVLLAFHFLKRTETPTVAVAPPPVKIVQAPRIETPSIVQPLPAVRTKPRLPSEAARVKPVSVPVAAEPIVDTKAAVKAAMKFYDDVRAAVKTPHDSLPPDVRSTIMNYSQGHVEQLLAAVPQVDLIPDYAQKSPKDLAKTAQAFVADNKDADDGFVRKLKTDRTDLAALPFLMGKECKTADKDARQLRTTSLLIRQALSKAEKQFASQYDSKNSRDEVRDDHRGKVFWQQLMYKQLGDTAATTLPAFKQILGAEIPATRAQFADKLSALKGPNATKILAEMAVYDPNSGVRAAAIDALRGRPPQEYRPLVLQAFRYPFAAVAQNAARVVVALDMKDTIKDLAALLDQPDPAEPFAVKQRDGKTKHFVRELVRVNHHRNCMLCHAAVDDKVLEDRKELQKLTLLPVGPVTSMEQSLPPSSTTIYYSVRPGITVVRADITYLRQDFSLMQEVEGHGRWPAMQRFDFLVRTRELTEKEAAQYTPPAGAADFKQSIVEALRGLTGEDHPANAAAWRREAMTKDRR